MWLLFDLLMDGEYRSLWDTAMVESYTLGFLNPNNDVGYYASEYFRRSGKVLYSKPNNGLVDIVSCPPPIQNRDFVLQRSWLATPKKISILNHSITHKDLPPKKYFVRGISYITGFFFTNYFSQPYLTAKLFCINKKKAT